nr:mevalonate kinase [Microbacterium sp. No. 7]
MSARVDVPDTSDARPEIDVAPPSGVGHASAKAILFGEHAVVFGEPAIAVPVRSLTASVRLHRTDGSARLDSALYHGPLHTAPLRLDVTTTALHAVLDHLGEPGAAVAMTIESTIPVERGLGSSAAVSAAIVHAALDAWRTTADDETIHELIQVSERRAHGSPSGLDARAVRATGPLWFQRGAVAGLEVATPLHLVIADSGVRGRTREAVQGVADRREADAATIDALIGALGGLSVAARDDLARGDLPRIGAGMSEAHRLLVELGVGDPALDHLARAAAGAGALGAKLTGGGRGGCVLALATDADHATAIAAHLRGAGASAVWTTTVEATT